MRILFVAEQLYIPQLYGGVQTSTDQLCHALMERGHNVSLLVKLMPGGLFGWRSRLYMRINRLLTGYKVAKDSGFGYPVWRAWFPSEVVDFVCKKERPDLIVLMSGGEMMPLVFAVQKTGIPILVQLHDVAIDKYGKHLNVLRNALCISNSRFTAQKYLDACGIVSSVIYPFIAAQQYRTKSTKQNVTFINPVSVKGCDLAIEIARLCPEIPFSSLRVGRCQKNSVKNCNKNYLHFQMLRFFNRTRTCARYTVSVKFFLCPVYMKRPLAAWLQKRKRVGFLLCLQLEAAYRSPSDLAVFCLTQMAQLMTGQMQFVNLGHDDAYYALMSEAALTYSKRKELDIQYQASLWEDAMKRVIDPMQK